MNIQTLDDAQDLVQLAIYAGQLLILNGAEIYRAEDTMIRMCQSRIGTGDEVSVVALNDTLFISLDFHDENITIFKTAEGSKINLSRIDALNDFSRQFVSGKISLDQAYKKLKKIESMPGYQQETRWLFSGLYAGGFAMLFGGSLVDFGVAYLIGMVLACFLDLVAPLDLSFFAENFVGAALSSFLTSLAFMAGIPLKRDMVIVGAIMLLVPGILITNSMRDVMSGDFISGTAGLVKAIFSALSIALGVGLILNMHFLWS